MRAARVLVRRPSGLRLLVVAGLAAALLGITQAPALAVAPQAFPASLTTAVDQPANVDLTTSVQDPDGGTRTYAIVTPPAHGGLSACGTGFCTYTPAAGYTGPDSFTWRVSDGTAFSNTETFSITVTSDPNGPAITSAGPLANIQTSSTLNCVVQRAGDAHGAFYADNACGTLAVVDNVLYGPATLPGGPAATPYTPVSQTAVTGAGTAASPYTLVTTVELGSTDVQLVQTDSYVVGQEGYRTDIVVKNSATPRTVRLYRAGDCQFAPPQEPDFLPDNATGSLSPVGSVGCTKGARLEQFLSLSPGAKRYEAQYDEVWNLVTTKAAFPDTCRCNDSIDNALGLQWDVVLGTSASATRSSVFTHSASSRSPVSLTSSVAPTTVAGGGTVTYTVNVANPGSVAAPLTQVVDTLPSGFTYQPGSTTGGITTDPTVTDGVLRWTVSTSIPAASTLTFSFVAVTPDGSSTSPHSVTATANPHYVVATGPTATVTVTSTNVAPNAVDDQLTVTRNVPGGVNVLTNDTDDGPLTITGKTDGTHGTVSCTTPTCTYTPEAGYVGTDSFTYTVTDSKGVFDTATVTVAVVPPNAVPNAISDTLTTTVNTPGSKNVTQNDTDADGHVLRVTGTTQGAHGSVVCGDTTCTYTPGTGYAGGDTFTYTITDDHGGSDTATVNVTVTAPPSFDLVVTATPLAASIGVGNLTGYRVTVRNNGPNTAPASSLKSTFPAGFRLRNVTAPGCARLSTTGCAVPQLVNGASASFLVYGAFTLVGSRNGSFALTASGDSNPGNNSPIAVTSVTGVNCTRVGTFGNDGLAGTNGRDVFCGLTGNDVVSPLLGNDVVYGNEGTDTVVYSTLARAVRINLGTRTATGQGTDTLSSIENATGSERADVIIGNSLANLLSGLGGNDVISGAGGNDRLLGGGGADRLSGGPGNDALNGGAGRDSCLQGAGTGPRTSC